MKSMSNSVQFDQGKAVLPAGARMHADVPSTAVQRISPKQSSVLTVPKFKESR
jgi:hypothetical protein